MKSPWEPVLRDRGTDQTWQLFKDIFHGELSNPTCKKPGRTGREWGMAEQGPAPQTEEEGNAQPVEAGICALGYGLDVYSSPNLFREPHQHKC